MRREGDVPGAVLRIITEEGDEQVIELRDRPIHIGLSEEGRSLRIGSPDEIPSESAHAVIRKAKEGYVLAPGGAPTEVTVNHLPVEGEVSLRDGDRIMLPGMTAQVWFHLRRPFRERWAHLERAAIWFRRQILQDHDRRMQMRAAAVAGALLAVVLVMWFAVTEYSLRLRVEELGEQIRQQQSALSEMQATMEEIKRKLDVVASNVEGEVTVAGRISNTYGPGVSLIEATYGFVEPGTGKLLRYAEATEGGVAITQGEQRFQVTTEGNGPVVEETVIGTGFLVAQGYLLTNLHVARPWWQDEAAEQIMSAGFRPRLVALNAYFPTIPTPIPLEVARVSEEYDLALCRLSRWNANLPIPPLADETVRIEVGQPVVLLGYPAGIEALLARLDESVARQIIAATALRVPEVTRELALRGLIRPMVTQGHVSARLPGRIVHDAATATGGSGGPLFNRHGVVVGINTAILREFSASNLAIPITVARPLLRAQGLTP